MVDIAIIGGGPAGVSAAINAHILNKSYIWFTRGASKKVERAELIRNYPALPDVTGEQLSRALYAHAESMGITETRAQVTGVYEGDGSFGILADGQMYEAASVILCVGVQTLKPVKGEEEFLGRGVSYCATCDGFLYKGKEIAVVAYDKSFEHEVAYLCSLAKKVLFIPLYKDCGISAENAEISVRTPVEYAGVARVEKIVFKDGERAVDGVFVLKSSISLATLVHGLETEGGHVKVDRALKTNIAGVFAAGDCTGRPYQYIKAAGEGNVAVHSAVEYLASR